MTGFEHGGIEEMDDETWRDFMRKLVESSEGDIRLMMHIIERLGKGDDAARILRDHLEYIRLRGMPQLCNFEGWGTVIVDIPGTGTRPRFLAHVRYAPVNRPCTAKDILADPGIPPFAKNLAQQIARWLIAHQPVAKDDPISANAANVLKCEDRTLLAVVRDGASRLKLEDVTGWSIPNTRWRVFSGAITPLTPEELQPSLSVNL